MPTLRQYVPLFLSPCNREQDEKTYTMTFFEIQDMRDEIANQAKCTSVVKCSDFKNFNAKTQCIKRAKGLLASERP